MLRNTTRNLLLATCFAAAPTFALAQSPSQQKAQPVETQAQQSQMSGKFLAVPLAGQMRAADLREADIYTADNQKVGDIDDILLDRKGQIVAVVVGVGGFLGVGEKKVAIPFESLDIPAPGAAMASNMNAAPATGVDRDRMTTGAVPDRNATDQQRQRATAQRAEEMSNQQANRQTTTTAATTQRTAQATSGLWKPERILLKNVTKADLQNAPEFNWDNSARNSSSTTNAPARSR